MCKYLCVVLALIAGLAAAGEQNTEKINLLFDGGKIMDRRYASYSIWLIRDEPGKVSMHRIDQEARGKAVRSCAIKVPAATSRRIERAYVMMIAQPRNGPGFLRVKSLDRNWNYSILGRGKDVDEEFEALRRSPVSARSICLTDLYQQDESSASPPALDAEFAPAAGAKARLLYQFPLGGELELWQGTLGGNGLLPFNARIDLPAAVTYPYESLDRGRWVIEHPELGRVEATLRTAAPEQRYKFVFPLPFRRNHAAWTRTIQGRVVTGAPGQEQAVAGAEIRLIALKTRGGLASPPDFVVKSAGDGRFQVHPTHRVFDSYSPSLEDVYSVRLHCRADGYGYEAMDVRSGTKDLVIRLTPVTPVKIQFLNDRGQPIVNLPVTVRTASESGAIYYIPGPLTDSQGYATFAWLKPGDYYFNYDPAPFRIEAGKFFYQNRPPVFIPAPVPAAEGASGKVIDRLTGKPIKGAKIGRNAPGATNFPDTLVTTGADGRFQAPFWDGINVQAEGYAPMMFYMSPSRPEATFAMFPSGHLELKIKAMPGLQCAWCKIFSAVQDQPVLDWNYNAPSLSLSVDHYRLTTSHDLPADYEFGLRLYFSLRTDPSRSPKKEMLVPYFLPQTFRLKAGEVRQVDVDVPRLIPVDVEIKADPWPENLKFTKVSAMSCWSMKPEFKALKTSIRYIDMDCSAGYADPQTHSARVWIWEGIPALLSVLPGQGPRMGEAGLNGYKMIKIENPRLNGMTDALHETLRLSRQDLVQAGVIKD